MLEKRYLQERVIATMGKRAWSEEETERLKELFKRYRNRRNYVHIIASKLDRSFDSVDSKIRKLGLRSIYPRDEESLNVDSLTASVLSYLKGSQYPVTVDDIKDTVSAFHGDVTSQEILFSIDLLTRQGYDIKRIQNGSRELFILVRYASPSIESYYRLLGRIETPMILTGDWHIGSVGFSEQVYNSMLEDIKEFSVKHVMIAGDILQGRGVHREEMQDLAMPRIEDQISYAISLMKRIPRDVKLHVVIGNHESKLKGSTRIGFDPLKVIASSIENCYYYGHLAKLRLGRRYVYLMMHGGGAITRAVSYRPETVWRELPEKPNILHYGHLHRMASIAMGPDHLIVVSGTMQRENAWLINKGIIPQLGWYVLREFNDGVIDLLDRRPRHY